MLIHWLSQELKQRNWDIALLATRAKLDPAHVEAVLNRIQPPDFLFCYHVAESMDKQPERLLNMAGLLSDPGLQLALQLDKKGARAHLDLYHLRAQLSLDERRLILQCAQQRGASSPIYNLLKPMPQEFNQRERTQDRLRFALLIILLTCLTVGGSILLALLLS